MTAVNPQRVIIQQEETQDRASVAASTVTRLAAVSNHNAAKTITWKFDVNGPYSQGGAQDNIEGPFFIEKDYDIIFVSLGVQTAGTGGTLEIDVRRYTTNNTPSGGASIFSTRPAIAFTAGNFAYVIKNMEDNTLLNTATGVTAPVLAISQLNAGEMLSMNMTGVQTGGNGFGFQLTLRER